MRLKKCFKTVLSAVLAAAMIVTAVPADTAMAAQTVQTNEEVTESTAEVDGAAQTEESAETQATETETQETGEENAAEEVVNENAVDITSPVIDENSITFNYDGSSYEKDGVATEVTSVYLMGEKYGWDPAAADVSKMTYSEDLGYWSISKDLLKPGTYGYKFVVNGSDWINDPKNTYYTSDGNSALYVPGLKDTSDTSIVIGTTIELPSTLKALKSDGTEEDREVTYTKTTETETYGEKITLGTNEDGKQTVTVSADWDTTVTTFTLTATDSSNNTCTVTVNVSAKEYKEDPTITGPVAGKGEITFYYFGPTASSVTVKGSMTGWEEKAMTRNEDTGYWVITLPAAKGTHEYGFMVDGNWTKDPLNMPVSGDNSTVEVTESSDVVSEVPIIDGRKVTFRYTDTEGTAEKVSVAGTMNGWDKTKNPMTKKAKYWELVMKDMAPGEYQYKFVVGDDGWITDPENTNALKDGNSVFWIAGLSDSAKEVSRDGVATTLDNKLTLYKNNGDSSDVAVTYSLSAATKKASYAKKITLATDEETGVTTVSVASDFPAKVNSFTLTATDENDNTSTVTVSVVDAKYTYTIYYYDEDHSTTEAAALWIWQTSGEGATAPVYFDTTEELEDGKTWLKATVDLSYTDVSIIPRAHDDWSWQDTTREYNNEEKEKNVTLYMVYEDDAEIYTELPKVTTIEKRYLVVEYTRSSSTPENWYLYTWNSGYGSNVFVPFEQQTDGKWVAKVRIKRGLESLSYCIERYDTETEAHWAEKDGNDYKCAVPADQTVVKICMEEGKGITKIYPYNDGYEIAPKDKKIHFYYRNNEAFLEGKADKYDSVKIEIDGTAYDMTFNAEEQRYTYDMTMADLESQTHNYRYILKTGESTEYVLDKYNTETVTANDTEYSVCKYEKFEAEATAQFANAEMDYNDNNVLSVVFKGTDGEEVEGVEVSSATADLTALGGGITEIDPQLLALSVAVKEGTAAGEKTIPVTVYDQYNNEYTTSATVTVTEREKNGDFDWDEAVIYFAVTDRFFDGNSKNNGTGYKKGTNGSSSYHGGDFAGLTKKLDYLQDLGVNTIWITPIVENKMEAGLKTDVVDILSWGYHGYWASDFTKLDSHLGTEEEFKALLDAAHARGMKIMVDVVLNHTGYGQEDYFNNILKDEDGNSIPMIRTSKQMDGGDQKSSLSGLPDFLTENEEVRELLVEWQSSWVSKFDIDYYRVDTVKHVDDTTWSAFKNALTEIDPDFKMIGEYAGAGYATDTGMLRTGRMDSLLDFDFNNQATAFVKGDIEATEKFLAARNAAIDNTATLGAFLGSHDEDGFVYNLINAEGMSEKDAKALGKVAASLQITTKGQVVIYYGEEIGLTGANNYPYQTNRYDFNWKLVNDKNDTLTHYKKLLAIRENYSEVLAKGTRTNIVASDELGLDIFERSYNGQKVWVGLNVTDTAAEYTLTGLTAGTYFVDVYGGKSYLVDGEGKVTISVPGISENGTAIFVESTGEEGFHATCSINKTYTGKAITLTEDELKVYDGVTLLTAGKDYKVTYKNNKKVGTATVTVQGTGNYEGKDTVTFNIVQKNIADEDVAVTYSEQMIATGKNLKPLSKVVYNGSTLKAADYKVEYFAVGEDGNAAETATNVKAAGKYKMVITGKGSFTGSVAKEITVHAKDSVTDISKLTVKIEGNKNYSVVFDGQPQTPEFAVYTKDGKEVDKANYDYKFVDNDKVGTASLIITGKTTATEDGGITGYIGTLTKTFVIKATKLSDVAEIDTTKWKDKVDFDETIGAAEQAGDMLKAKAADSTLTFEEGTDYTVSYSKNTKAGKATVIYTGIGKYTGTIKKNFTVNAIALFDKDGNAASELVDISGIGTTAEFAQKGSKVSVVVKFNGTTLVEGVDYKVSYKNNKAVTTENTKANKKPQVTITAMNGYTGKTTKTFEITAKDLADVNMSVADVAYQNKKGKFMCAPVLTDADGMKLKANKDYTVKYYLGDEELTKNDVVDAGETVKVVVEAKSANYKGSKEASYNITVQDISKAKVVVNAQVYTGKEITITSDDISTIKVGDTKLKEGKHYVILQDSYVNNINKGTASVTIKGIGNYGGTKTVTFKITGRTMAWWWNLIH